MSAPVLLSAIKTQRNEDWEDSFEFYLGDTNTPDPIHTDLVEVAIATTINGKVSKLTASTLDGRVQVNANVVSINVPLEAMSVLPLGTYSFEMRRTYSTGNREIIVKGNLILSDGVI